MLETGRISMKERNGSMRSKEALEKVRRILGYPKRFKISSKLVERNREEIEEEVEKSGRMLVPGEDFDWYWVYTEDDIILICRVIYSLIPVIRDNFYHEYMEKFYKVFPEKKEAEGWFLLTPRERVWSLKSWLKAAKNALKEKYEA